MKELVEQVTAIAEFRPFESRMLEFRRRYADVVYDLRDPTQERQARSDRFQIGKVIGELDRSHKAIKAPLQKQVTLIDGERKRIKDDLLEIQGRIKAQIAARDEEIRIKAEQVQKAIDAITSLTTLDSTVTATQIQERLRSANNVDPESALYGIRKADAALELRRAIAILEDIHKKRIQYEAEQAELAKLSAEREAQERQAREDKIRREAAEKAKREADERARVAAEAAKRKEEQEAKKLRQAIEAERQAKADAEAAKLKAIDDARKAKEAAHAAEERRKREIIEANERAKREAHHAAECAARKERERIKQEQREAQQKAEADRKAAEKKAENVKHRERIDREASEDLMRIALRGPDDEEIGDAVTRILKAIKACEIRHIGINY